MLQFLFTPKNYKNNKLKLIVIVIFLFISFYYVLSIFNYNYNDWFQDRLLSEGSITETTRVKAIDNTLFFLRQNPILGNGQWRSIQVEDYSRSIGSSQIHVGYLAHTVSYGLLGSTLLFSFWFSILKDLYKSAKKHKYWGSFFAFTIFLWANMTLVYYSVFTYGLIFSYIFNKYYITKNKDQ
jgi:hypothetical protein